VSDDLVKQLRDRAEKHLAATPVSLLRHAADRIENLQIEMCAAQAIIDILEEDQARIEALEAQLSQANAALEAADNLLRAVDFLADNDPYEVVCDGGGTAILVGLSGIRKGITAYRKARGQDATGEA
jgi:rhodanese-related sulfurtransferase